jgi:hypothetical protein
MSRAKPARRLSDAAKRKGYTSRLQNPPRVSQQVQIIKPPKRVSPEMKAARPAGQRETVEEFLARGGRIQQLPNGASGEPYFESMRERNDRLLTRLDRETEFQ